MPKHIFYFCTFVLLFASQASGQLTTVTDFSFDDSTGEFSVIGTGAGDSIIITVNGDNIVEVGNVGSGVNADDVVTIFVDGFAGDDQIDLSGVVAANFTGISATAGAITIEGGAGNDTIFGSALNDTIKGEAGDDNIYGGAGDDHLLGDRPIGVQDGLVLNFVDATSELGGSNLDRTKDAEIADINNDGLPDIYDANSNIPTWSRFLVVRLNDGEGGFSAEEIVPMSPLNAVTYDSDLADLDGDGYPDLIRTLNSQVAVYFNLEEPNWFNIDRPDYINAPGGTPDDIAVGDLDNDGDLDFAVARRRTGGVEVYINRGGRLGFDPLSSDVLLSTAEGSTHDVFLVDANNDGKLDIVAANENNGRNSRLFRSVGMGTNLVFELDPQTFPVARGGESADFNRDGADDLIFGGPTFFNGGGGVSVLLNENDPSNPWQFSDPITLDVENASSIYDLEIGDLNNDGFLDVIGASISRAARIWLNDGTGNLELFGGADPIRDLTFEQWLSADLIDYDLDGDLDLYMAGGDGDGIVENQFFINTAIESGDDHLEGGPGHDTICGGAGNDLIFGGTMGGQSIVGDVNRDGMVDFSDIPAFIAVLQAGNFQFEADADGNGVVDFSDIPAFIDLLEGEVLVDGDDTLKGDAGADLIFGGAGNDTLFAFRSGVGDVNRDGRVDFSDIPSFIAVLQAGTYQFEADVDGNGLVNFSDIPSFIDLLSGDVQPELLRDGRKDVLIPGIEDGDVVINDGT